MFIRIGIVTVNISKIDAVYVKSDEIHLIGPQVPVNMRVFSTRPSSDYYSSSCEALLAWIEAGMPKPHEINFMLDVDKWYALRNR